MRPHRFFMETTVLATFWNTINNTNKWVGSLVLLAPMSHHSSSFSIVQPAAQTRHRNAAYHRRVQCSKQISPHWHRRRCLSSKRIVFISASCGLLISFAVSLIFDITKKPPAPQNEVKFFHSLDRHYSINLKNKANARKTFGTRSSLRNANLTMWSVLFHITSNCLCETKFVKE